MRAVLVSADCDVSIGDHYRDRIATQDSRWKTYALPINADRIADFGLSQFALLRLDIGKPRPMRTRDLVHVASDRMAWIYYDPADGPDGVCRVNSVFIII